MLPSIEHRLAAEIAAKPAQIAAAIALLDEGATVPFIARYRKEATGGLDDTQLRTLEERLRYLRELEERRAAILESITEQGKLTPELRTRSSQRRDQAAPGRPVPALQAEAPHQGADRQEAGLEPLADALLADPTLNPREAAKYLRDLHDRAGRQPRRARRQGRARRRAPDPDGALRRGRRAAAGAARIPAGTRHASNPKVREGKEAAGAKFRDYFDYPRAARHRSFAPRAGAVPRPQRGHADVGCASRLRGGAAELERAAQSLRGA